MAKATHGMLSSNEISTFCTQISMVLKAGIPLNAGVAMMHDDVQSAEGRALLANIAAHVEEGEPLHLALAACEKFPSYVLHMVEIGEQSGRLDEVMDSLCSYYERDEALSKSIRSAVTYPLLMLGMMLLVIGVLIFNVLPIFNQVFVQLGSEMSAFSRGVLALGTGMARYSGVIVGVVLALVLFFFVLRATQRGRTLLAHFRENFFATRKLSAKIAIGRFASALSLMLSSGLDSDQALDLTEKLVEHSGIRKKITVCRTLVAQGRSFAEALAQSGLFTGVYAQMISVGFQTGAVDLAMKKLAERYEDEAEEQIGNTISILEPSLVALLSVLVGMILLSVMLPLMGMMSSIGA